jgi:hypothetical protein
LAGRFHADFRRANSDSASGASVGVSVVGRLSTGPKAVARARQAGRNRVEIVEIAGTRVLRPRQS